MIPIQETVQTILVSAKQSRFSQQPSVCSLIIDNPLSRCKPRKGDLGKIRFIFSVPRRGRRAAPCGAAPEARGRAGSCPPGRQRRYPPSDRRITLPQVSRIMSRSCEVMNEDLPLIREQQAKQPHHCRFARAVGAD